MSQRDESAGNSDEVSPEGPDAIKQPEAQSEEVRALTTVTDPKAEPVRARPGSREKGQQAGSREPGVADAQLLTRVLVGLLSSGSGDLMQRLRDLENDIETHPEFVEPGKSEHDETTSDLLRYLALGLLMRSQRTAIRGVRSGFYMSLGTASWFFGKMDGLTNNRLMGPIRRPVASRLRSLEKTTSEIIIEGKREERVSRLLAKEAALETIDDVVEVVSENPEVTQMLTEVIGGQTAGLATVVRDNARQLGMTSDDVVEGLLRRLLRRTPRRELPPSPLAGESQTMYSVEVPEEQKGHDER
jgi:hypothetical protein